VKKFIFLLAVFGFVIPCLGAETEYSKTVAKLAVEANDKGYLRVEEPLNVACKYNVIYFHLNTESGKAQYSMLLAAKMSNTYISTLAYNFNSDTTCTLLTVEIE